MCSLRYHYNQGRLPTGRGPCLSVRFLNNKRKKMIICGRVKAQIVTSSPKLFVLSLSSKSPHAVLYKCPSSIPLTLVTLPHSVLIKTLDDITAIPFLRFLLFFFSLAEELLPIIRGQTEMSLRFRIADRHQTLVCDQDQGLVCDQHRGSDCDQEQGLVCDQGSGCAQGQGSVCDQGQGLM